MKGLFASMLMATTLSAQATELDRGLIGNGINQLSNAIVCDTFKDAQSGVGRAIRTQCANRASAQFAAMPERKSLKECIKPGNVIDDDVRKCMKGM